MTAAVTLSLYIVRVFALSVLVMLSALTGLVSLFDFIELLRQSASHPAATFWVLSKIEALRLPYLALQVLPFAVLLGGMFAFWRLTRSSELIVARASGVSAWEFLTAPVIAAFLIGALATGGVTPLSSAMFARAETMQNTYLNAGGGPLDLADGQLWLRQADHGLVRRGTAILHASDVTLVGKSLRAQAVTVFRLNHADQLLSRIEAVRGVLANGEWTLAHARAMHPDAAPDPPRTIVLPTDLTVTRVQESFAAPDTLSVWELPGFIALLNRSGFSSVGHQLHFEALLALPLFCATMTLVAAGFSMRPARRGGVAKMIGGGAAAGFVLFMISKLAEEFGESGAIPVMLAAWAPAAAGMMLAVALLLHMEDG